MRVLSALPTKGESITTWINLKSKNRFDMVPSAVVVDMRLKSTFVWFGVCWVAWGFLRTSLGMALVALRLLGSHGCCFFLLCKFSSANVWVAEAKPALPMLLCRRDAVTEACVRDKVIRC